MRLSAVVPVYNEAAAAVESVRTLTAELDGADAFTEAEIVIADDGSSDDTALSAKAAETTIPVLVVRLAENRGRLEARRAGLGAASGDFVLFLDAGVGIERGGLQFLGERVHGGEKVWNAHTIMRTERNPFGKFWEVVSALAFADYFDDPRTTSFGLAEFDRFPKGTTCFFAPRELLEEAFRAFRSRYSDPRYANDDGPIIRSIAERTPIHISPSFACIYTPRDSLRSFVRHAAHRGVVFLDGHGRRESRFFPVVIAFYPLTVGGVVATTLWPTTLIAVVGGVAVLSAFAAVRAHRPRADVVSFAALAPVYAIAHGLGMWKGLGLAIGAAIRRRR